MTIVRNINRGFVSGDLMNEATTSFNSADNDAVNNIKVSGVESCKKINSGGLCLGSTNLLTKTYQYWGDLCKKYLFPPKEVIGCCP